MKSALKINVFGIVQGVGFRPFVYRLAKRYLICGWVLNSKEGVEIHAEGDERLVDEFVLELSQNHPAAALVREIDLKEVPLEDFETFEIRFSDEQETKQTTLVSADLATCEDCVRELFDPADRRFRYPFINCTNCGPRFTIIDELPYDRIRTSMADFEMCSTCAHEYEDPKDRRFHAQPDACFECGPTLWFTCRTDEGFSEPAQASTRAQSDALIARCVELLCAGKILAVKGLGGFHLVCDAHNEQAISKLRARKHREGKPFAVMVQDVAAAEQYCQVNEIEAHLLKGVQRPIVLLKKRSDAALAAGLADALPELGVMLPYTPVQHLLMHDFVAAGGNMLVMTSGNVHDAPIEIDDDHARVALGDIADAFLGNNRPIRARYDDSVVRVIEAAGEPAIQLVRRARGYCPVPLELGGRKSTQEGGNGVAHDATHRTEQDTMQAKVQADGQAPAQAGAYASGENAREVFSLLATGPEQKNTLCLVKGSQAFVSQHIGDLEHAETFDAWLETKKRYQRLFEACPTQLVCDMHPEYLSSKWAHEQALPLLEVQHHHAHIASVIGEHGITDPVCGVAFDGTGYGPDGAIWGGEILLANAQAYERFANFAYVPMPGGAACVREPLRMAYGALWSFDLLEHPAAQQALAPLGEAPALFERMIDQGINTPYTSSVGRLFDAASALLGICTQPSYEGEAAILLEAAIDYDAPYTADARYTITVEKNTATESSTAYDTSVVLFDAAGVFEALLDDVAAGVATHIIARRFHDAFVGAIVQGAELMDAVYGIRTVVLSGGVFLNRYITEHALSCLARAGFTVAINRDLPPHDGCISFGQAYVGYNQQHS